MPSCVARVRRFLLLGSSAVCSCSDIMAKELLSKANIAFGSGDFESAHSLFSQLLEKVSEKQQHVLRSNMGACLVNLGKVEEAVVEYDAALALCPDHAESHHNKGVALASLKRFDEALESFNACLSRSPKFYPALCGKSETLSNLSQFEEAAKIAREATVLDATKSTAFSDLAFALLKVHDNEGASKAYEKAVQLGDTTEETKRLASIAHSEWALELEKKGAGVDGAINAYRKSGKFKACASTYHNMAILHVRNGDDELAAEAFRRAVEINPNYVQSHAALGAVLSKMGKHKDAVLSLKIALDLDSSSTDTRYNYGLALSIQENRVTRKRNSKRCWR